MEYGEAITSNAAEQAFSIARKFVIDRSDEMHSVSAEALAKAYCVCVADGEDAAEGHTSVIDATLINEVEMRLQEHLDKRGLN